MTLDLAVGRIFRAHCALILILLGAYLFFQILFFTRGSDYVFGIAPLFDLADEAAIPTFVASAGLLATGGVAWLIACREIPRSLLRRSWLFVAFCLVFMAFDEAAGLHDRLSEPMQHWLGTTGIFYFGWLPVYILLTAVVGALCLPLAFALPRQTTLRLIVAGTIFIGGALGVEMIEASILSDAVGGRPLDQADFQLIDRDPLNRTCIGLEEGGELFGTALALRALLLHLVTDLGVTRIGLLASPGAGKLSAG